MEPKSTVEMVRDLVDRYRKVYGLTPTETLHQIRIDAKTEIAAQVAREVVD